MESTTTKGTTTMTTDHETSTVDIVAILENFGIDTDGTLGTHILSSLLRSCWDLEDAKRSLRSCAASVTNHAERLIVNELDRGYSPTEARWVAVNAQRLEEAAANFERSVTAIRVSIETLACLVDEERRSDFYAQMRAACFGKIDEQ